MLNNASHDDWDELKFAICSTDLRDDPGYIRDYILLANFIVMAFLPFVILTVINTMLYRAITRFIIRVGNEKFWIVSEKKG